jgi:hypothetical protein
MELYRLVVRIVASLALTSLLGCSPEVGSTRWCELMQDKPRGDWTANEALDYGRHCLFDGR